MDGTIQPEGIEITPIISRPSETFFRMLRHKEFEVSELSFANYTMLRARGDESFIAIPVFPSRLFRHSCIYVNKKAGIETPEDLIGKKIGVPEYSMTAAVFARGMLLHEYGVKPETIEWFSGTQDGLQRPSRIDFELKNVTLHRMPLERDMGPMLETGELDAIISPNAPKALDRSESPVRRLFEDYRQAEKNYFAKTGIFPIMHTVVLRRDIYEAYPWAATSLYEAFVKAKDWAYSQLIETDALKLTLPWVVAEMEETRRIMGHDFWPYGINRNRVSLEALPQYLYEQNLAAREPAIEELFAPNTLDHQFS
ncbi:MAG: 4,5-dihydroxyphthalate decarboxylase [Chloroflexi bacterium]|jgi:4,5-dihydroxyphthalate decarboxylase|nr:MAG: 4,5-dihydroxyphthalate decarboxylase [Chloroflexota bacterium]